MPWPFYLYPRASDQFNNGAYCGNFRRVIPTEDEMSEEVASPPGEADRGRRPYCHSCVTEGEGPRKSRGQFTPSEVEGQAEGKEGI